MPIVAIDSPAYGELITGFVDVIGTVTDSTLASYELSVAPFAGVLSRRSRVARIPSPMGSWDASIPRCCLTTPMCCDSGDRHGRTGINGRYSRRCQQRAENRQLRASFTDLTIPVSGIPITVSRTYDSLTAGHESELGYGWRMEIKDADLRTTVSKTGAEESLIYAPYFDGARVFITVPGGRRSGVYFPRRAGDDDRRPYARPASRRICSRSGY